MATKISPRGTTGKARCPLGSVCVTLGVRAAIDKDELAGLISRHKYGDWGELPEEDRQANELALEAGHRLLSIYESRNGETVWIITEADRSATTVLLPDEY